LGLSNTNVVYTGRKNSNGTLSGTMIGYDGIATFSGTWTATR